MSETDRKALETTAAIIITGAHTKLVVARCRGSGGSMTIVGGDSLVDTNESGINDTSDFVVAGCFDGGIHVGKELI